VEMCKEEWVLAAACDRAVRRCSSAKRLGLGGGVDIGEVSAEDAE
jgi:hypothetical protein